MAAKKIPPMKLSEAREAYEGLSGKASDIIRQLSLAALALVWIFKQGDSANTASIDIALIRGAGLAIAAVVCDLLQYLAATSIWYRFFSAEQDKVAQTLPADKLPEEQLVIPPDDINTPIWVFFWLKAALMIAAYALFLLPFLAKKIVGH
jgi:hypothetical protein